MKKNHIPKTSHQTSGFAPEDPCRKLENVGMRWHEVTSACKPCTGRSWWSHKINDMEKPFFPFFGIWMFPRIGGKPPKRRVEINENPIQMDDLEENPLFSVNIPYLWTLTYRMWRMVNQLISRWLTFSVLVYLGHTRKTTEIIIKYTPEV